MIWIPAFVFQLIFCCVTHLCILFSWHHLTVASVLPIPIAMGIEITMYDLLKNHPVLFATSVLSMDYPLAISKSHFLCPGSMPGLFVPVYTFPHGDAYG